MEVGASLDYHRYYRTLVSEDATLMKRKNLFLNYGDIISGTYYYQLDTDDEWEYSYIVSGLTDTSMIWTAKEDMGEMKVYTRCNEVPADIIAGTRASF